MASGDYPPLDLWGQMAQQQMSVGQALGMMGAPPRDWDAEGIDYVRRALNPHFYATPRAAILTPVTKWLLAYLALAASLLALGGLF